MAGRRRDLDSTRVIGLLITVALIAGEVSRRSGFR
jgi:hypothetical protein